MSSDSEPEPPSTSTSKRMESERLGIQALLAQVPRSLSKSESSHPSKESNDENQSERTVPKNKAKSKIIFAFFFLSISHFILLMCS